MYFQSRSKQVVENGIAKTIQSFCYTSFKGLTTSVAHNGVTEEFSLTYWDGKPKDSATSQSKASFTMWLNNKTKEQAEALRDVKGAQCVVIACLDEQGSITTELVSLSDFGAKHPDADFCTPEQMKAFTGI